MTKSELEIFDRPIDVINWIKRMSDLEFFRNVDVITFGDMAFIYPKAMDKDKAIKILKKYWRVHSQ